MSQSTPARPPQVTMAAWVTMLGSLFLLFSLFDMVANIRSLDTRERVEEALSEPPLRGLDFGVEQALSFLHVLSLVAAACATAAAILGWQVMRRSRPARVVLSCVVVPLFVAGLVTGGFLSSMVAVAAVLLWTRPARDWFDGKDPVREPARESAGSATRDPFAAGAPPTTPPDASPAPYAGFGTGPVDRPAFTNRRPRPLVQACIVAWVFSGVVAVSMIAALVAFAADPRLVEDLYESDPRFAEGQIGVDALRAFTMALAGFFLAWAVTVLAVTTLTFRGHQWARITLIVSAAVAGVLGLLMAIAAPALLLLSAACGLSVLLLLRPATTAWFDHRS